MKALIQRVVQAKVTVDQEIVGEIGRGLCVLIGISKDDTVKDLEYIVRKILSIRLFESENGKKWDKTVVECDHEILCVSQFTLYHSLKGNKPDFRNAMPSEQSQAMYNDLLSRLRQSYLPDRIKDGRFGAYMQVHIQNDGPVTIELESPLPQPKQGKKPKEIENGTAE